MRASVVTGGTSAPWVCATGGTATASLGAPSASFDGGMEVVRRSIDVYAV